MTDNEIIKALEYWKEFDKEIDQMLSGRFKEDDMLLEQKVIVTITLELFDLINRLQAENEGLKEEIELFHSDHTYKIVKAKTKAEAYKECIEKVKKQIENNNAIDAEWLRNFLNNLLKELVGND